MALRCSLLGHDYGDTNVEHEREERGSEVVVTVQEYEECARCGDRNVISENTEVRSISTEADVDSSPDTERKAEPIDSDAVEPSIDDPVESDTAGTTVEFDEDEADAELIDADTDGPATGASVTETKTETANGDEDEFDVPTDENGEPVTDDGEILDDDDKTPIDRDRGHGEWPDSDDVGPPVDAETEPPEWPDADDPETATAATTDSELEDPADPDEPVTDDAIVLEDDTGRGTESGAAADARSTTTAPPTRTDGETLETEPRLDPTDETDATVGSGIERSTTAPAPGQDDGPRDDVPTEFYCPNCNYVAAGDRGSLRAGDICPECRKGYLGERNRR